MVSDAELESLFKEDVNNLKIIWNRYMDKDAWEVCIMTRTNENISDRKFYYERLDIPGDLVTDENRVLIEKILRYTMLLRLLRRYVSLLEKEKGEED